MKKTDKGFTLVELLIVIVILGVLAAVVVFAVGGITNDSKKNACGVEKRTVETAIEAYYANKSTWPAGAGDLTPGILRSTPAYWTVGAGGAVSAATTLPAGCV